MLTKNLSYIFMNYIFRIFLFLFIIVISTSYTKAGPNINYTELLPGQNIYQSLGNGWTTPVANGVKDIITPEPVLQYIGSNTPQGCKRIRTGNISEVFFIPTRSLLEWIAFRMFLPNNNITIENCPIDAICGNRGNTCQAGNPTGYSAPSCGGTQHWTCEGLNGGDNVSCSTPNIPCPTCNTSERSCYNGNRESYDSASCNEQETWTCRGGRLNTDTVSCNAINSSCYWETSHWGGCSASCGGGVRYRSVWCYDPHTGHDTNDWRCGGGKPAESQSCNAHPCCHPNTGEDCIADVVYWDGYSKRRYENQWCDSDWGGQCFQWYNAYDYECPPGDNPEDSCYVFCTAGPAKGIMQCNGECRARTEAYNGWKCH